MNILILSPKMPFPPKDGGSVATMNIAEGLADSGNNVTLLCLNTLKHFYPEENISPEIKKKLRFISVKHDTSPKIFKAILNFLFSSKPYISVRFNSKAYEKKLKELLINEEFDLVQCEGPYLKDYFRFVRELSRALISFRPQNVESEIWQGISKNENCLIKKFYFKNLAERILKLEKEVLDASDILVPISEKDARFFLSVKKDTPFHILPTGLYVNEYQYNEPAYNYSFFFLGALDWKPNQMGLLWFIDNVWRKYAFDAEFHIAGRRAPVWLGKILHKIPGIVFHGEVENAKQFMSHYGIMICPLFAGSGIRIKIIESMLMAKVVITTPIGAEGLNVTDGENIIISNYPHEFYEKIMALKENPEYAKSIGKNATDFITGNFNNLALCNKLSDFYMKCIQ